jgi:signal transduction histidine kinase
MRVSWPKSTLRPARAPGGTPPPDLPAAARTRTLGRRFGDLNVRIKLMILHNLFFLALAVSIYLALIPQFRERVARAKQIEVSLLTQMLSDDHSALRLPHMNGYDYREGSAQALQVPPDAKEWLDNHDGHVCYGPAGSDYLYRKNLATGQYARITLPNLLYDAEVKRAKTVLFLVLGGIYGLAVLFLEMVILPRHVHHPLNLMLDADRATQAGDRDRELIPESQITNDEIGQIMRSRNLTVAELRRHEDELAAAISHLEAQDRLASLGLLSTSVAHEMNTPLAVLQGSVEKLIETVPQPQAQERLERMLRVTRRLKKISEGLVDFARVRKLDFEKVALRPLVEEAWALVAIDEKASGVQFHNLTAESDAVAGNADRLVQVFVNLLRNALDAVSPSGQITVSTRTCLKEGKRWLAVSVDDNGSGIPPEVLPEIFDAFVTSRLDSRGTGLGLAVAEGIVHQHGGTITASNRPGGGARLEVTLRSAA